MARTEIILQIDAHLLEQARAANLPLSQIAEEAITIALAAIERGQDWQEAIRTHEWAKLHNSAPARNHSARSAES